MKRTKKKLEEPAFKIGDRVRVRGYRTIARIEMFYIDIEGGVILDRRIGDFRSWNVDALIKVGGRPKVKHA